MVKVLRRDKFTLDLISNPKFLPILRSSIQFSYREVEFKNSEFHALLWKLYANVIVRYDVLKQLFNNSKDDEFSYLYSYTLTLIKGLRQNLEVNTSTPIMGNFDHKILMARYHLKIVTFIFKTFRPFEDEYVKDLYNLLHEFYYFLFLYIPTYYSTADAGIRRDLTLDVEALLQCLTCENAFVSVLLQPISEDLKPETKIAHWLLKLSAMQLQQNYKGTFCNYTTKNCTVNTFVMRSIMENLYTCDPELLSIYLTVVPLKESISREITVYEYIYMLLCRFASNCCPRHFQELEKHMLKVLLGRMDNVTCLICDVWYFFCRCGPHELIREHCCFFEKLIPKVPRCTFIWIKFLMKRLIKLVPEMKFQLLIHCPILTSEIASEDPIVGIKSYPDHLLYFIRHIKDTRLSSFSTSLRKLKMVDQIVYSEQIDEALIQGLQIEAVSCLLDLSACVVLFSKADQRSLLQILHFAGLMWNSSCDIIQLNVLFLLQAWGHVVLPPGLYKNKILHCLGKIFDLALDHENSIIQHQALCVFYEFAYLTPYTEVVQGCLRRTHNKPLLKNFLMKVESGVSLHGKDLIGSLLHQRKWLKKNKNIKLQKNLDLDILYIVCCQQRMHKNDMQKLQLNLKMMKDAARKLASFQQLPSWALKSLKDTCQFMDKIND